MRLPPATHGNGDNGFIPTAIGFARDKGAAAYVGDGTNRWPSVHRDDAARLFRLALESAPAGSVLHAVGDQGVPIREIADIFAKHLAIPAVSVTAEHVAEYVGVWGRGKALFETEDRVAAGRSASEPPSRWGGSCNGAPWPHRAERG